MGILPGISNQKFIKVLLVDDETQIAELYQHVLNKAGIMVGVATSGTQALQTLRKEKFDIAFIDVMMPDMNGITLLKSIRSENLNPEMAIILLTNIEEDTILQQGFALGIQALMLKSQLAPLQLVDIVKSSIQTKIKSPKIQQVNNQEADSPSQISIEQQPKINPPTPNQGGFLKKFLSIFRK